MRDLGRMGESAFSQWCASVGLTANNSHVDQTGWDFLVEFDFNTHESLEYSTIHDAALECKVQVKSTDKIDRKLAIKLSNLKRLATAAIPAFFVFIEFDGTDSAQRVFVVHLDKTLSSKIMSRLHDIEQEGNSHLLHKKTLTIRYDDSHLLCDVTGLALVAAMRASIGPSMSDYVAQKHVHLRTTGFDDGFAKLTFSVEGVEAMSRLVDMSIGIAVDAEISNVKGFKQRFGRKSRIPFLTEANVKLGIPDLKPNFEGTIKFKADKLGPAFSFPVKVYFSPFNPGVPKDLHRARIVGDFFDLIFNPSTGAPTFTFSVPVEVVEIRVLRDALKLLEALSTSGDYMLLELVLPDLPITKFEAKSPGSPFVLSTELAAVEAALRILTRLDIPNRVEMSLERASRYSSRLAEMDNVLSADAKSFKLEIPRLREPLAKNKALVCLSFFWTPVGNIVVGAFVTMIGNPLPSDGGGFLLLPATKTIERILARERGEAVDRNELARAAEAIEQKYERQQYEVITLFDKNFF